MNKQFKIGDKISPDDIEVGMIVDIVNKESGNIVRSDVKVIELLVCGGFEHSECAFGNYMSYNVVFKGPVSSADNTSCLSERSIAEAIKTLSQSSQELQTSVSVNSKGELTVYSNYHEKDLTFNLDSLDQLVQYVECVKKLDKFKD